MELMTKKNFKQTEVGLIPEDWDVTFLSEVTSLITDGAHLSPPTSISGYPIATVENINKGFIDIESCRIISKNDYTYLVRNNCKPEKGDVLLSKDGTIGITFTIKENQELVLLSSIALIRPNKNVLSGNYLSYTFKSDWFYIFLNRVKGGSALKRIVLRDISKFIFASPPTLTEQKAIATALSDVDALIFSLEQSLTKKKAIKQGAMQQLLTPPHKGGKRLPGFSGDWNEKTIKEIVSTPVTDGPHETPIFVREGVPFLSVNNIVNNKIDYSALRFISKDDDLKYSGKCKPVKNDILLGKAASVGKVAVVDNDWDFNIWSPLALIRCKNVYAPYFVYYSFQTVDMFKQIDGLTNSSSQGNIGMGDIEKLKIFFPKEYEEQKAIAQILSDMDAEITQLENKKEKYQAIKQGMMQELLTGKTRLI